MCVSHTSLPSTESLSCTRDPESFFLSLVCFSVSSSKETTRNCRNLMIICNDLSSRVFMSIMWSSVFCLSLVLHNTKLPQQTHYLKNLNFPWSPSPSPSIHSHSAVAHFLLLLLPSHDKSPSWSHHENGFWRIRIRLLENSSFRIIDGNWWNLVGTDRIHFILTLLISKKGKTLPF